MGEDYLSDIWEEIIVLGGEGGTVSLLGKRTLDDTWIFVKETNESALADFLDDEDLLNLVHQRSPEVTDWEQATALLGRTWMKLRPLVVHPEFKQLIWREVSSQSEYDLLSDWESLLFID